MAALLALWCRLLACWSARWSARLYRYRHLPPRPQISPWSQWTRERSPFATVVTL